MPEPRSTNPLPLKTPARSAQSKRPWSARSPVRTRKLPITEPKIPITAIKIGRTYASESKLATALSPKTAFEPIMPAATAVGTATTASEIVATIDPT